MKKPIIIAGPCSAENEQQVIETAQLLATSNKITALRAGAWKPRTKPGSFEGMGEIALTWLKEASRLTNLPVAVEVANACHVEVALKHDIDILWIGARSTVNPFTVQEIAEALRGTNTKIMIKNPINPDTNLWSGAIERIQKAGIEDITLIHRGFSSYTPVTYRNPPMWHIAVEMRAKHPNIPIICDPSHMAGKKELIPALCQEAADLYYDGLIIESHVNPSCALSDSAQQLTPLELHNLIDNIIWKEAATLEPNYLSKIERLRNYIDQNDSDLLQMMSNRMKIAQRIGTAKRAAGVALYQPGRWDKIVKETLEKSAKLELSDEFVRDLLNAMHAESLRHQRKIMREKI